MDIEVNNIHLNIIEADLRRLFSPFGEVAGIELMRDKLSNRSSGRALVDMPVEKQALIAIATLHGKVVSGKAITVIKFNAPVITDKQ